MEAELKHVAIIMDGNGRWATNRVLPRVAGHYKGIDAVKSVISECVERKLEVLTLFAFSTENWGRPTQEVNILMTLFQKLLNDELEKLIENKIRFKVIGDRDLLPKNLVNILNKAEQKTLNNSGLKLNVAINYGGKWDIVNACKNISKSILNNSLDIGSITEQTFEEHMSLVGIPPVDLLIRTGGEYRISNFLLWNLAYAEIFFTSVLWPDFSVQELDAAFQFFAGRKRRFGHIPNIKRAANAES